MTTLPIPTDIVWADGAAPIGHYGIDAPGALFHHGEYQVRADVDRFTFHDGSMVGLHPVLRHGVPQLLLRCVRTDAHTWHLFSLAELMPECVPELQLQPARDQRGWILYTLRGRFPGARAFMQAVQAIAKASGACDPDWRAAA